MSDYIRMLSYIYSYEDDRKNSNVGFAKIDGRNGIVRVLINIRDGYRNDMRMMKLYTYRNEKEMLTVQEIGGFRLVNGVCEYRTQLRSEAVTGSDGMYITTTDNEELNRLEYATCFKDTNTNISQIREKIDDKPKQKDTDMPIITTESVGDSTPEYWEQLSRKYPQSRMLGEEYEAIKIKAADIESLPKEYWILGKNSFLLHGYYFYRHIILAKNLKEDGYYIGVPGYYQKNEQIAATMFGFDNFVHSREQGSDGPGYGYWITKVD